MGTELLERPGLHVSCLPSLRDHDVSVLVWDMLDHLPIGYDIPWAVHAVLFAYGVALLDARRSYHSPLPRFDTFRGQVNDPGLLGRDPRRATSVSAAGL